MHFKQQLDVKIWLSQTVFADDCSTTVMDTRTNGDADSDEEDVSAPVKRRRKMVLIDEED